MKSRKPAYAFLINSLQLGGAERVVQTLANEFSEQYDVHLITLEGDVVFSLNKCVTIHNLSSPEREVGKVGKLILLIYHALKLKKYLRKNNIKIVLSNLFRSNYVNILARVLGSEHFVCTVDHTLPVRLHKEGMSGKVNLFLIRQLYKYAGASISVSQKVQSQLLSMTDLPASRYVINNPFDLDYIALRSRDPVDDFVYVNGEIYLISVGRLNTVKRYDLIISAMNLLDDDRLNLIVIGAEENVKVADLLAASEKKDKLHFLGARENPYKYIFNSDMLILSSESESFGNVLVESMICGTPVLASRCGGPEEIINDGYNGILVDVGDAIQLAKAIKKSVYDEARMAMMADNALSDVVKYDVKEIVCQYKKVLESFR